MDEAIVRNGVDRLYHHMVRERTGDPWQDHGIGYVMFAQREKRLFRGLNDEKRIHHFRRYGDLIWEKLTAALSTYPPFADLTQEQVYQVQVTRWLYAHGLAFQVCSHPAGVRDDDKILFMMQQGSSAIYDGLINSFSEYVRT